MPRAALALMRVTALALAASFVTGVVLCLSDLTLVAPPFRARDPDSREFEVGVLVAACVVGATAGVAASSIIWRTLRHASGLVLALPSAVAICTIVLNHVSARVASARVGITLTGLIGIVTLYALRLLIELLAKVFVVRTSTSIAVGRIVAGVALFSASCALLHAVGGYLALRGRWLTHVPLAVLTLASMPACMAALLARATRRRPEGLLLLSGPAAAAAMLLIRAAGSREVRSAEVVELHTYFGKSALRLVRRVGDLDRDGSSAWFSGGDCDDRNSRINPKALEIPGNGVDEDCDGEDLNEYVEMRGPQPEAKQERSSRDKLVILVTVDSLRADFIESFLGKSAACNSARAADAGAVFDRAFAAAPSTRPSLAALLSGRYPEGLAKRSANDYDASIPMPVALMAGDGVLTVSLPSLPFLADDPIYTKGFSEVDRSCLLPSNDAIRIMNNDRCLAGALASRVLRLGRAGGRAFIWAHFLGPHADYLGRDGLPCESSVARECYRGEVEAWDNAFVQVVEAVEAVRSIKPVVLIVTADHGEAFGEHGDIHHGVELWPEVVRVPLFFFGDGVPRLRLHAVVSLVDVMPTSLALLGQATTGLRIDGVSLLPYISSEREDGDRREVMFGNPTGDEFERHGFVSLGRIFAITPSLRTMSVQLENNSAPTLYNEESIKEVSAARRKLAGIRAAVVRPSAVD